MAVQIDKLISDLEAAVAPLPEDVRTQYSREHREARLNDCYAFKNYILGIIILILVVDMIIRASFAGVNLGSAISPFGSPLAIAASFTAIAGFFAVLFTVVDFLYSYKIIGCDGFALTHHEIESLEQWENAFFIPGCVYDCRMIQNRIDFNSIRYFIPLGMSIVLINMWIDGPEGSAPALGTVEGIRYACSHLLSFGVQLMILLCIVMNLYALRRRRPRIDTLHIAFWFDVERHWSGDSHAPPGHILQ